MEKKQKKQENKKPKFPAGCVVVPNNNIWSAFIYTGPNQIVEGVEYRQATDSEEIYWYKRVKDSGNTQSVTSFSEYKENNTNYDMGEDFYEDEDFKTFKQKKQVYDQVFGGKNMF